MKSRINEILNEIKIKKEELFAEYDKLKDEYDFHFEKGRIVFTKKTRDYNKKFKQGVLKYLLSAQIRHLISAPFIYMVIIPTVILDIFLFIFQQTCFRLYRIPFVKRSEYLSDERKHLDYLNIIQKFNCLYCSYVNGIFAYAVEIGARTERYWCPIKHAKKMKGAHNLHNDFADFGDPDGFKEVFNKN